MEVVSVALNLLPQGFVAGLGVAGGAAKKFGKDVADDFDAPKKNLSGLGTAGLIMGGVVAAGFGLAVKSTLDFDKSLSELGATIGANGGQMESLREKALQLGKDTAFSASEAAQAMVELGKVGLTTDQIMGGAADATVALAAAGGVDLPQAATIAAAAMTQFKLSAADLPHVADLLAGAANASAADVEGLGVALAYVGPVAAAMGMSIDDTAAALSLLSNGGLSASMTGTALRSILGSLQPEIDKTREAFDRLNLTTEDGQSIFYDTTGTIKPLNEVLDILRGTFDGMTKAERAANVELLFGERALAAINIIVGTTDEEFTKLKETLANTSAEDVAAEKLDNLAGDLEALGGTIEVSLIETGSKANGVLRMMAQGAAGVVDGFSETPAVFQNFVLGAVAVTGLGAGVGGLAVKFAVLQEEMRKGGRAAQFAERNMTRLGKLAGLAGGIFLLGEALSAVGGALVDFGSGDTERYLASLKVASAEGLDGKLKEDIGGLKDAIDQLEMHDTMSVSNLFNGIGAAIQKGAVDEATQKIEDLDQALKQLFEEDPGQAGRAYVQVLLALGITTKEGAELFDDYRGAVDDAGLAVEGAEGKVDGLTDEMDENAESTEKAKKAWEEYQGKLKEALDPLFGYTSALLDVRDAQDKHNEAALKYIEAARIHGEGSIEAAEALRDLERAQLDVGTSAMDVDVAMRQLQEGLADGSVSAETFKATMERWVAQGIVTRAEADAMTWSQGLYINKLNETPSTKGTHVTTTGIEIAIAKWNALYDAIGRVPIGASVNLNGQPYTMYGPGLGRARERALGGPLAPRSIYELHDTPEPEWVEVGGRTFLLTGSAGGMVQSGHPGAHAPIPQTAPIYPAMNYGGGGATGTTVVNRTINVTVEQNWPHYLGDRADTRAIARELKDDLVYEISRDIDSLGR